MRSTYPLRPACRLRPVLGILLGLIAMSQVALISGCTLTRPEITRLAVDVSLLRVEYRSAAEALRSIPFAAGERRLVNHALGELDEVRQRLSALSLRPSRAPRWLATSVIRYATARSLIDEIAGAYSTIKVTYASYRERTGAPASPALTRYAQSAEGAYAALVRMATNPASTQRGVNARQIVRYLLRVLRGYALIRSGGVSGLL